MYLPIGIDLICLGRTSGMMLFSEKLFAGDSVAKYTIGF